MVSTFWVFDWLLSLLLSRTAMRVTAVLWVAALVLLLRRNSRFRIAARCIAVYGALYFAGILYLSLQFASAR